MSPRFGPEPYGIEIPRSAVVVVTDTVTGQRWEISAMALVHDPRIMRMLTDLLVVLGAADRVRVEYQNGTR